MKKGYLGLWLILAFALALLITASAFDPIKVGPIELRNSGIIERLTKTPTFKQPTGFDSITEATASTKPIVAESDPFPYPTDTTSQTILFIGDSMLEGLSPRLAAYAKHNGHSLYSVIWYSSTSEIWGRCDTLTTFINRYKPTFVVLCLGANELFVRDIEQKRAKYVDRIIKQIGKIPYLWIGPPNWKDDTGINRLVESQTPKGSFFLSNGMHFERSKDGAHPTRQSAAEWMDSVVRWMPSHSNHPIKLNTPTEKSARATKVIVLQPQK